MNRGKDLKSARKKVVRQKICQMMKHTPKTTRYISQPFISGGDYLTTQTVVRSICALFIAAFRGLKCHPLACIVLKVRLAADSNPSLSARSLSRTISAKLIFRLKKIGQPASPNYCHCPRELSEYHEWAAKLLLTSLRKI
jgi:hypothetical protein